MHFASLGKNTLNLWLNDHLTWRYLSGKKSSQLILFSKKLRGFFLISKSFEWNSECFLPLNLFDSKSIVWIWEFCERIFLDLQVIWVEFRVFSSSQLIWLQVNWVDLRIERDLFPLIYLQVNYSFSQGFRVFFPRSYICIRSGSRLHFATFSNIVVNTNSQWKVD